MTSRKLPSPPWFTIFSILLLFVYLAFVIGYGRGYSLALKDAAPICGKAMLEVADEGVKACKEAISKVAKAYRGTTEIRSIPPNP